MHSLVIPGVLTHRRVDEIDDPIEGGIIDAVACAADPSQPELWYLSVAPGPGKAYGRQAEAYLYRSDGDAGWQPIGWEAHPMGAMPIALVTDPAACGHLYAGLVYGSVCFSADYGDSWEKLPFSLKSIWTSMLVL